MAGRSGYGLNLLRLRPDRAKGIGSLLETDRGFRTMARQNFNRFGQRKKPGLDAVQQLLVIAARQVGPPDAVVK